MKVLAPLLILLAVPAAALAQPRDAAGSEWLFREGRALMKKGDFVAACPKLAESLRFDPAVGTLMNLAECEERLGRTASAWQRWEAAADQLPAADRRRATALARARALEALLPRLIVTVAESAPKDLVVTRDGIALGAASLGVALPVDPGRHLITASASGHAARTFEVTIENGQQQSVTVEAGAAALQPPPMPSVSPLPVAAAPAPGSEGALRATTVPGARRSSGRLLGLGLVIAGGATLAVGGYFGLQAMAARREAASACVAFGDTNRCWSSAAEPLDRDRRASLAADIAFGVGAATTAAGLYLVLRRRPSAEPTATAQVMSVPQGGGIQVAGRF
jgi:hypothetical protein